MGTSRTKANNKWNAKAYDRYSLMLKKGHKEQLQAYARNRGESLNAFINRAISETIQRDNS